MRNFIWSPLTQWVKSTHWLDFECVGNLFGDWFKHKMSFPGTFVLLYCKFVIKSWFLHKIRKTNFLCFPIRANRCTNAILQNVNKIYKHRRDIAKHWCDIAKLLLLILKNYCNVMKPQRDIKASALYQCIENSITCELVIRIDFYMYVMHILYLSFTQMERKV